jgi:predicted DNA-binding transcriptional regulator AlpA
MKPIRLHRNDAAKLLSISVSTLRRRVDNEPGFPQPIKDGTSRAALVYFSTKEIEDYAQKQFDNREEKIAA